MKCLLFHPETQELKSGGEELIKSWRASDSATIWVHLTGELTKEASDTFRDSFSLHPLALQDASRDRHPPKLEEFEDHTFLILKTLSEDTKDIDFAAIQNCFFIADRFLVSRSSERCLSIEKLWASEMETPVRFGRGIDSIISRLMRIFMDRYLEILLDLESKLEILEDGLLDKVDDTVLAVVTGYKADLKKLRRIFLYHEQMLRELKEGTFPGFSEACHHELNDVYEQQERASSLTLLYYELCSDLIDGYLSLSSHRLNQIMKVLTIVTVVFVPLGFLAGIYGMNFVNIPELQNRYGYFILLSVMATIATTLLISFRRKRWL
ncbi:MAG: magnesium/cobalt transporter CorA [Verrucomicrobiales bacterium]|nr:magnesium/cobalt transporter CorA [Verrucomicrobiales bacterium]